MISPANCRFDCKSGRLFSPFQVTFRYLRVPVLSTHVSNNDFDCHLPDLTMQVVGQFSHFQLPLDIFRFPIAFKYFRVPVRSTLTMISQPPAQYDCTGGWPVSLFLVGFRYLRVPVLSTQVFDNDFQRHLPDLATQVVGLFPYSKFPLDICMHLCLVRRYLTMISPAASLISLYRWLANFPVPSCV